MLSAPFRAEWVVTRSGAWEEPPTAAWSVPKKIAQWFHATIAYWS